MTLLAPRLTLRSFWRTNPKYGWGAVPGPSIAPKLPWLRWPRPGPGRATISGRERAPLNPEPQPAPGYRSRPLRSRLRGVTGGKRAGRPQCSRCPPEEPRPRRYALSPNEPKVHAGRAWACNLPSPLTGPALGLVSAGPRRGGGEAGSGVGGGARKFPLLLRMQFVDVSLSGILKGDTLSLAQPPTLWSREPRRCPVYWPHSSEDQGYGPEPPTLGGSGGSEAPPEKGQLQGQPRPPFPSRSPAGACYLHPTEVPGGARGPWKLAAAGVPIRKWLAGPAPVRRANRARTLDLGREDVSGQLWPGQSLTSTTSGSPLPSEGFEAFTHFYLRYLGTC